MIMHAEAIEIVVGTYQNPLQLLNLPLSEAVDFEYQFDGQHIAAVMAQGLATESQLSRIIDMLHKLPIHDEAQWQPYRTQPIFWILPHLEKQQLVDWVSRLHALFPHCFEHPHSRFFPMGSAGFFSALSALKALPVDSQSAIFIAVDSLYFALSDLQNEQELITQQQDSGRCPAEAVIMANINVATDGMHVLDLFQESCSLVQQTQAIKTLFNRACQVDDIDQLSQLYLPGNHSTVTDNWLNAYEQLAGKINQDTQITQSSYFTGDIGCVVGLYNFLHIYNRYQQQTVTGISLQLEVSQQLHLGVAMYSWIEKA
ncbi:MULTISPECIES: hypothetical protein [Shewanella]|jgi:hypothetical protein|uniref:hypothetical protein n=1 Tax=Shewanella TaxID=22 RepID=UPI000C607FF4|nr:MULTISPECIES: hypothetical protein [Shewanella]NCQ43588.1 hypothetical protein [Shewanella frigidimarina]MBB1391743.1 hypothetical protein [Shewanella sp. SG44-6]NCO69962.1 hypothetical protein [Shewanella vesiculosa]NCP35502.1 hypothetical protein [Shewanella vesiculosa]NCP68083.1 hypothetical protein [Shewanella vesiculosa]